MKNSMWSGSKEFGQTMEEMFANPLKKKQLDSIRKKGGGIFMYKGIMYEMRVVGNMSAISPHYKVY